MHTLRFPNSSIRAKMPSRKGWPLDAISQGAARSRQGRRGSARPQPARRGAAPIACAGATATVAAQRRKRT
ncbi:hypothetical protein B296_00033123 [Ensete ventricosum]|uniref:Uncharacterized protein n=1 Tax=Ensete ventricosum TaxID=4639 RepID=A0A426YFU4_ENSVE|nr:hypothetical protein B296_00033123 [Ensete ventricosum]